MEEKLTQEQMNNMPTLTCSCGTTYYLGEPPRIGGSWRDETITKGELVNMLNETLIAMDKQQTRFWQINDRWLTRKHKEMINLSFALSYGALETLIKKVEGRKRGH
jgi:hypothetical protein